MSSTARVRVRRGTAAAWTAANPILLLGEIAAETDTLHFKVGNGVSAWNALPYFSTASPEVRGQLSRLTPGTVSGITAGVYKSTGLLGVLDTATANGIGLGTTDTFALKNTSGITRLMRVLGSMDASAGNNHYIGIKLALNGVVIDETECRAFTGSGNAEAKLVCEWLVTMPANSEVALFVTNVTDTTSINFKRGRLVASEVIYT